MAYVETSTPGGGSRRAYPSFFHGDSSVPNRDQSLEEATARAVHRHKQREYSADEASAVAVGFSPTAIAAAQQQQQQQQQREERSRMDLSGWFAPDQAGNHWAVWTFLFTLTTCFIFAFMAGQYSTYQVKGQLTKVAAGSSTSFNINNITWGPPNLQHWLQFWEMAPDTMFDFDYLQAWGGRYGPDMASGRWWQIITSIFIHSSFSHLLSNIALFLILATPLEHSYGTARIFVVWLVAGLAGSLASAAWEAPCSLVVGASGAVFGFVGLYIADIALNFESMVLPLARLAAMVVGLVFLIVLQVVDSRSGNKATSHMSHVGGFIAGLCVSFLFLPNFKDRRWRMARKQAKQQGHNLPRNWTQEYSEYQSVWSKYPRLAACMNLLGVAVMLMFFLALPLYLWRSKYVNLSC